MIHMIQELFGRTLRAEIGELGGAIRQLRRSGMDSAAAELHITRKRAELESLLNAKPRIAD
jgi:hypothetical protein